MFFNAPAVYLEIGHNSLRVLDGDDGLELSLERNENGRLNPLCAERLTLGLRVFLKKHRWRPRLRAFCAIGARGVALRRLALPPASKEELQRLLHFQIEREFPLPPDELAWGCCQLSQEPQPAARATTAQEVLVIAVKKGLLEEYAQLLSGCALNPVFTLGALARSALCPETPRSYAVLDIGRNHSELLLVEHGAPASIRVLPWGGENLTQAIEKRLGVSRVEAEKLKVHLEEASASGGQLGSTIRTVLQAELGVLAKMIQTQPIGPKLYLAGASARLREIAPRLANAFGDATDCEPLVVAPGEGRSAAILGLKKSCEQGGGSLPLILQLKKARNGESPARPGAWKWAALAALLLFGSLSLRYAEAFVQKPRLARKLSEIKVYRDKLPRIDQELNFLQYLKTNQAPYLDALHVLANAAPAGARLESLSMNRRGELSLRAGMKDPQQAVNFRSKLIDSGFFSTVVVEEQTPTPDRQKITVQISARWKPSTDRTSPPSAPSRPEPEKSPALGQAVTPGPLESPGTSAPAAPAIPSARPEKKE